MDKISFGEYVICAADFVPDVKCSTDALSIDIGFVMRQRSRKLTRSLRPQLACPLVEESLSMVGLDSLLQRDVWREQGQHLDEKESLYKSKTIQESDD